MANKVIYVVEDEPDIAELISYNLSLRGYTVKTFSSGEEGFKAILANPPDLVLLDIMLPGLSGLDVCQRIKQSDQFQKVPIIMVSAKGEENDIVRGLELGADDYITKPFSTSVLNARVEAVLRRTQATGLPANKDHIQLHGLEVHVGRVEVKVEGRPVELTQTEFKILHFLMQKPGWVFTRNQIVEGIRGENYAVTERSIDFQMVGLRKKIEPKGDLIETVRGVGYRFKDIA